MLEEKIVKCPECGSQRSFKDGSSPSFNGLLLIDSSEPLMSKGLLGAH